MPSLQYYFFRTMMVFMRRQQSSFPVHDVNALVRFRKRSDRMADMTMRPPHGITVDKTSIGGVRGDWLIPENAPEKPVILFFHGGGIVFTWGSPHRRMLGYLAKFADLRAFGVDYRLVPDHCYPAAHDDCFAVYQALVQQGKSVVLVGESSGGVLALATLLRAKAAGLPQPLICVLISPAVDYGFKNDLIWQARDPFVDARFVVEMHKHYFAGHDVTSPDLSPINADLSGLAPLYILGAEQDILRSEIERLAEAARRANLKTDVMLWPRVWHGWHLLAPDLPEGTAALKFLGNTIRQYVR